MNAFLDAIYRTRHIRAQDVTDAIEHDHNRGILPAKEDNKPAAADDSSESTAAQQQVERLQAVQRCHVPELAVDNGSCPDELEEAVLELQRRRRAAA